MKGNVIQMNTLHLNSVRLNGIGKVQSVSLKGGSTEDPVFPPVEPPIEPTPTYTLSASVTNGKVSAKHNGSAVNLPYTANEGDVIVLEVTPNDGYTFEGWADGNTDNPRSITMTADVALSAQCVEVVQPPVGKYIQFEDPAVEAICVANWSSDGIGLTEEDAAAVTTFGTAFKGNTEITSFDESKYFTGVTTINANAFKGCTALRTISFEHITKVGNDASWNAGAFDGCTSLERAIMPKVTEIANYSFANCGSLAEAYMPNVTLIGASAFKGSRIGGSHTIEYCHSIGASAFMGTYIEEIIAPSLTSITGQWESGSFADCRSLRTVRVGDAVALGERTFRNCSSLETFIISATTPPSLNAALFSGASSTFLIYVPDASLEAYKTATNWNTYADRIHPLSEIEDYYVSDALLMHLDGINKGNVDGEWQDLVSGNTFVNHGAIAEADGWRFDGASSYMDSTTLINKGWWQSKRTMEVVVVFDDITLAKTEVVFMGRKNCFAFGKYLDEHFVNTADYSVTSMKIQHENNVVIYGFSLDNEKSPQGIANGKKLVTDYSNAFAGGHANIAFLGKRATGNHFKGKIYAIRLHDRVLTEEEILYNQRIDNKRFNLGLDI